METLNMNERGLRIALLGTRGIPARYGGFETFAEEISKRLVKRGHRVSVFCRKRFFERVKDTEYQGVHLTYRSTIMQKYLETPLHSLMSFLSLIFAKYDVVLLCNAANSPFAWIARIRGLPVAINVDGIERKRSKWNSLGKLWYRLGEVSSVLFASKVVSDAQVIADYYRQRFHIESEVIAYGAEADSRQPGEVLNQFHLTEHGYILYVSRLERENNALGVIEAYNRLNIDQPLVIVGDAPYAKEYIAELHKEAEKKDSSKIIFTGYQFEDAYKELRSNCLLYIQATEVGGTHPALIEAMAYGNCIIANGTPENREVLGDAGEFYDINDFEMLAQKINVLVADQNGRRRYGNLAKERAKQHYNWDLVTDQYEELFRRLCFRSEL